MSDTFDVIQENGGNVIDVHEDHSPNVVSFNYSKISDLTPVAPALQKLERMESLFLDETKVADLSPIAGLTKLKVLHAANTVTNDRVFIL